MLTAATVTVSVAVVVAVYSCVACPACRRQLRHIRVPAQLRVLVRRLASFREATGVGITLACDYCRTPLEVVYE